MTQIFDDVLIMLLLNADDGYDHESVHGNVGEVGDGDVGAGNAGDVADDDVNGASDGDDDDSVEGNNGEAIRVVLRRKHSFA